jgi:hypothetical protein
MTSYSWNGGSGGWGTISNWSGGIPNSATADATIAAAGTYTVTVENAKTYTVDSVTLNDATAILDVAGTLDLAGSLALMNIDSGTLELAGLVSGGTIDLNNNVLIAAGGTISKTTSFSQGGGGFINLNGSSLTLAGTSLLQGYITGPGVLVNAGVATLTDDVYFEAGTTLDDTGTVSLASGMQWGSNGTAAAELTIAAGGVFDITAANTGWGDDGTLNVINAGLLENTSGGYYNVSFNSFTNATTGTISVTGNSDISLLGGTASLAGTITGAGDVYIGQGDTASLQSGVVLNVGILTVSDGNTLLILESNQTVGGDFIEQNSAGIDLNGKVLSLTGSGDLNAYVYGGGTIILAGTLDSDFYLASGTEELVTGTALDATGNTRLDYDNGAAASILSIAGTGTFDVTAVNTNIDDNGALGTILNAGLFEVTEPGTAGSYVNVYQNFTNASTGTIYLQADDDVSLVQGQNSLAGTIDGPGDLYIGQGSTTTLAASLVLNAGVLTISDGGTNVFLESNRSIGGVFNALNASVLNLDGTTLTLTGSGTLSDYINGPGTLDVTGTFANGGAYLGSGVTEVLSGVEYQTNETRLDYDGGTAAAEISITSTGTYDIVSDSTIDDYYNYDNYGTIINAGLFEKTGNTSYTNVYAAFTNAASGTIVIDPGLDISFLNNQTNDIAGTITGGGDLYFGQGGTELIEAGAVFGNLAAVTVSDSNTQFILEGNRGFGTATLFTDQSGADVELNGNTLTLAGRSQFSNAYVQGNGELLITGNADFNGLNVIGTATIIDSGTITQDGYDELGTNNSAQVTLSISAGAVYDILNDSIINPQNGAPIFNAGLFEKTAGGGVSDIYSVIDNTGTIDAASGILRFHSGGTLGGTLTGAGEIDLNGGVFTLAANAVLSVANLYLNGGDLLLEGNVTDTGLFELVNGGTLNLDGYTMSLGNPGDYLSNNYVFGPGTLSESGRADINGLNLVGGAVLSDLGTITQDGGFTMGDSSSDTATLNIAAGATYEMLNDNGIGTNGAAATINNAGLFEKTADNGGANIYAAFDNTATGTLDALAGDINLLGGGTLAGKLTGAGEITLSDYYAGQYTLAAAAVVNVATLGINGGSLDLLSSRSFTDIVIETGGALNLNGFNATLTGADTLENAYINGLGTLDITGGVYVQNEYIAGGAVLLDGGTITADGNGLFLGASGTDSDTLTIAAGAVYDFVSDNNIAVNGTGTVSNAGLYEKTADNGVSGDYAVFVNTGTVDAVRGTLQFLGGGTLGGTLEGAGAIDLLGGVFTLQTTAVVSIGTLEDNYATLDFLNNRTLTGVVTEGNYGNFALGGHTLTLTGQDSVDGNVTGPGTLDITGASDIGGMNIGAGAAVVISGNAYTDGPIYIGQTSTDTAVLSITSTGTLAMLNDNGIVTSPAASFINAGLLEKTGSGTGRSVIQGPNFTNTGTILVETGLLEMQSLTNDGIVSIVNGTGQVDAGVVATTGDHGIFDLGGNATLYDEYGIAASQTIVLSGSHNVLDIGSSGPFAATISGFGATDTIDLDGITANGLSYAGGVLTLKDNGTSVASIALSGIANAGSLGLISDGNGGTDITFGSPGTITQPSGSIVSDVFTAAGGNFNTAGNWSSGSVPGSNAVAAYSGSSLVTDSGNDTVYQMDFSGPSVTFSQTGGVLTVIDGGVIAAGGNGGPGFISQAAGAAIINETGDLSLFANGTLAGTLGGTGEIDIGGNSGNGFTPVTIAAGAVFSVATLGIQQAILEGNESFVGVFEGIGGGDISLNGYTLTLAGRSFLAPTYSYGISGPGTLLISGSAEAAAFGINGSATLAVTGTFTDDQYVNLGNGGTDASSISISATGIFDMAADSYINGNGAPTLINSGLLEQTGDYGTSTIQYVNITQTSTGTLDAARGTLDLYQDAGTLAGTLAGNFIDLNGSAITLAAGAVINAATLQINGGNTISLGGGRTYSGNFDMSGRGGGTLNLGGFLLDLTGTSELGGEYVGGGGTMKVTGATDMNGMQLVNNTTLVDAATITADGGLTLGYYGTDDTALIINTGAVYDFINGSGIGANGTAAITNDGLFEKTANVSTSTVYAAFTNASTGTLDVAIGTVELAGGGSLAGKIEGAGQLFLQNNNAVATLATSLVTVATLDVNEQLLLQNSLSYAGDFILTNNLDLNGNNVTLTGPAALDSSVEGAGTLNVASGDISGLYLYQGAVMNIAGTVTQDGGFNMSNTGTDSTVLNIEKSAVFDLLDNYNINNNGTAVINNAGLFERTNDYGSNAIYATFTNASTGTIDAAHGFLNFDGGGSFAGTLIGGQDGTISDGGIGFGGGNATLAATAVLTVAALDLTNGDLALGGNFDYTGSFSGTGGSLSLDGDSISLTSAYLGGFYLTGPGTMSVTGSNTLNGLGEISGATLIDAGTIVQDGGYQLGYSGTDASALSIVSGAVFDIISDNYIGASGTVGVFNAGLFEKTADNGYSGIQSGFTNLSTGVIDAAYGTLGFAGGGVLGGTLEGAGQIELDGNGDMLTSTHVTVGTLNIEAQTTLGSNLTYGGNFILGYSDGMDIAGQHLDLTGNADLIGAFSGAGTVTVANFATVQTADLYGGATLLDTGTIVQIDQLRFSEDDESSDTLSIAATGVYDIQDDTNFENFNNGSSSEIVINAGLLEKTGNNGLSELQVTVTNTGTVLVDSGTLQIDGVSNLAGGTLSGGTWAVDAGLLGPTLALEGGTIAVDAAAIILSGIGAEIYAGGIALQASLTSIAATGLLDLANGQSFAATQSVTDAGNILLAGGLFSAPSLSISAGGTLAGAGSVAGPVVNNGLIDALAGTLDLTSSLSGTGSLLIGSGDELILGSGVSAGERITFGSSLAVLGLGAPGAMLGTLVSLAPSDTIDLEGLAAKSASIAGNTLVVSLTAGGTIAYALATPNTLDRLVTQSDGKGGTDITAFREATASTVTPSPKNFGQAHTGAVLTQTYTISNTAVVNPYSENLDASMGAHSTTVKDSGSFTGLQAGHTNSTALHATLATTAGGLVSGTATVNLYTDGTGIPGDGLGSLALASETVSLTGTIFNYATASTAAPNPIVFGEAHAGATDRQSLSLANTAASGKYSENLDASFSGTSADLSATGSISELAAGGTNNTALAIALSSATGGSFTGTTTLGLVSDGTGIDSLGTTALGAQTIKVSGEFFNYATASALAPAPVNLGEGHVGTGLSESLSLQNTAAPGAYSENLDANFSGTSADLTGSGTVSELAAGGTSTGLTIALNSGSAGVQSGTASVSLISDGSGIDTLGTTSLGSQTVTVSGTLFNYATASAVSPLAFGEHHVGTSSAQFITISNNAATGGYSENLDAGIAGTSGGLSGSGSVSELAAGATSANGLDLTLSSGTAGVISGSATIGLISDGSTIDTLGTTSLGSETVTASGTYFNYATASTIAPVNFGEAHVGGTLSQYLILSNKAAPGGYSENLDASFSGTSADLTGSGAVSELSAGATSSNGLDLVLNSGTAGSITGKATIGLISDGSTIDTLGTTQLAGQTVAVSAELFNYATASTVAPVNFGIVHVGQTVAQTIKLTNTAATGKFSENLDASFSGTNGSFTTSGAVSELKAGQNSGTSLAVTLQTGTAGTLSGSTTLALVSDGKGIDTLGTTVLGGQTIALTGTVNNYATATVEAISGKGSLSSAGETFTLNFGTVKLKAAGIKENIGILNSATGPADSLSGSFALSGTTGFTNTGFASFSGEGAGAADTAPTIVLNTATLGTFTETIVIDPTGSNASGYKGALAPETLIVTGTVSASGAVAAPAATPSASASPSVSASPSANPTQMNFLAPAPKASPAQPATTAASTTVVTGREAASQNSELQPQASTGKAAIGYHAPSYGTSGEIQPPPQTMHGMTSMSPGGVVTPYVRPPAEHQVFGHPS